MKKTPDIRPKGDGKGRLKKRKIKFELQGKKFTLAAKATAPRIEPAKWETPTMPEPERTKRTPKGSRKPTRRRK